MAQPGRREVIDITDGRAPEFSGAKLRDELDALRRVRDGEARRLEARIAELERLLPQIWRHERRIEDLTADLEEERLRRSSAELAAASLAEEVESLRRTLAAERERTARLIGRGSPAIPADPYRVWERRFRQRAERATDDEASRLRERVAAQRRVLEEKEARIARLAALLADVEPAAGAPDDLTEISGIGPAIADILHGEGITEFEQIAALPPEEIERLGELMPVYAGRIRDDDWIGQARRLSGERAARHRGREQES